MANGYARGRGWLNLKKNASPPKPLGLSPPPELSPPPLSRSPSPRLATSKHQKLVNRVAKISLDDEIKLHSEMQLILQYWLNDCSGKDEVEASFEDLYNACLHQAELGSKLVVLMASRTFLLQNIHGRNMRRNFLARLQKDIDSSVKLQTIDTLKFQNCVHMLGEFYNKARGTNLKPYTFLAPHLISYMEMLLNGKHIPDLIVFTNQLFLNGLSLNTNVPKQLANLGVQIRIMIITEPQLLQETKLWLLLALDFFNVQFGLLPAEVYTYYEGQLGSAALKHIQSPSDVKSSSSIQVNETSEEVDQSNVNVLQISTPPTEAPQNEIQGSHCTNQFKDNGIQQNSFPQDGPKSEEKRGRPLKGAAARLTKLRQQLNAEQQAK